MKRSEVIAVYDETYARRYDDTFMHAPEHAFHRKAELELGLLRLLTLGAASWLDVACGTGWFLARGRGHAGLRVAGLDLSPAMLAEARRHNPDALLVEGDFLAARPEWDGRWDVVSCMWGAYGLVESWDEIARLAGNLCRWTATGGAVFVPLFDPERFLSLEAGGELQPGVTLHDGGTRWTHVDEAGVVHADVLSPPVADMRALFAADFASVDIVPYPDDWRPRVPMVGLVARGRR